MIGASLRSAASVLGGDIAGRNGIVCPGPGHSPRDRSLHITFSSSAADGFLVYSHAGDDWRECRDYVRGRLGMPAWEPGDERDRSIDPARVRERDRRAVDRESAPRSLTDDDRQRIQWAREIWDAAVNPAGTLAADYLMLRRLKLSDAVAGRVLRFHARCPWRNENTGETERVPALIAAFRSVDDDQITAVHRIALNADATKRGKRMLGIVHRAAVKLDPAPIDGELAIGEGIETCMAADQLGISPVWALGSSGAISHFPVLPNVQRLRILGENDGASDKAVEFCGPRWKAAGRRVSVIKPTFEFKDLNDALGAHLI